MWSGRDMTKNFNDSLMIFGWAAPKKAGFKCRNSGKDRRSQWIASFIRTHSLGNKLRYLTPLIKTIIGQNSGKLELIPSLVTMNVKIPDIVQVCWQISSPPQEPEVANCPLDGCLKELQLLLHYFNLLILTLLQTLFQNKRCSGNLVHKTSPQI